MGGVLQFGRELPMVLYDGASFRRALRSRADAVGHRSQVPRPGRIDLLPTFRSGECEWRSLFR